MAEPILSTVKIVMNFGGLVSVNRMDFDLYKGEILGIIGPNGAGKTTFFNVLTGIYKPSLGTVSYHGRDITGKKLHEITALGLARTFQNIRLFPHMTVLETVMLGMHTRTKSGLLDALLRTPRLKKTEKESETKALELLRLTGLDKYRYEYGTSLPYGMQRRLEIARAMASRPEILLLDEPAAGMNEQETSDLSAFIKSLRDMGYTIILIEHDMRLVMDICDRLYVLDHGIMIAQGKPAEISANPQVIEVYLGKEE
ncbi:MAG: ABC transporter ATP-binding protein [Treponema sp.]|jgi:branched-chain amino acid transport system ATP-binding protein|nr:ABC transporter ATP-binding protein [Treponema sp.]